MNKNTAPRAGELTPEEEEHNARLSEWAENLDTLPPGSQVTKTDQPGAGRALLEAALGSTEAVERAVGRPSLGRAGTSPSRTLRLPSDLDAALVARAKAENRKPSEVVREALYAYLGKAS